MIHDTQSAKISQKQDGRRNIYVIMKTMCPLGYHHNGFVPTHVLGHMMYCIMLLALLVEHSLVHWYQQCVTVHHVPKCMSCHKAIVVITGRAHCFIYMVFTTEGFFEVVIGSWPE